MISVKKAVASVAAVGMAVGMIALAPVASADNYAPELPSNTVAPQQNIRAVITGAQPQCRVTFTIRNVGGSDRVNRGVVERERVTVNDSGVAASTLQAPRRPGTYLLITRVDGPGCTPTKSVQRIRVER